MVLGTLVVLFYHPFYGLTHYKWFGCHLFKDCKFGIRDLGWMHACFIEKLLVNASTKEELVSLIQ